MKAYLKRVIKAVLNKRTVYNMEKEYLISSQKRFEQKIALVTGASGAIGGAIAWRFALEGAVVYLGGRNQAKLSEIAQKMKEQGLNAKPCVIDVNENKSIENAVNKIIQLENHIDVLVNCAGGSTRNNCANLIDQSVEMIDEMLDTNLRGSMLCTRAVGKHMATAGKGKIVNISSVI